jgi:RNA recognition motif-containing protein
MDSTEELEQSAHMAIVVEEQMDLHVTKVSDRTSDTHVFQTFSEYGKIIWLRKVEFVSMGTRSYLIAFRDEKDGEKAMREMNGMRVKGNHWKITRTQLSESHLSSKAIRTPSSRQHVLCLNFNRPPCLNSNRTDY